jgi:hypothetical protein
MTANPDGKVVPTIGDFDNFVPPTVATTRER